VLSFNKRNVSGCTHTHTHRETETQIDKCSDAVTDTSNTFHTHTDTKRKASHVKETRQTNSQSNRMSKLGMGIVQKISILISELLYTNKYRSYRF